MKEKFYQKTWFVILMIIFVFPVGLILMWYYKKFNNIARIIITVLFALALLSGLFGGESSDTANSSTETTENTENTTEANVDKMAMKEMDSQIWQVVTNAEERLNKLQSAVSAGNSTEIYQICNDIANAVTQDYAQLDKQKEIYGSVADEYIGEARLYDTHTNSIANNIKEYMDTSDTKYADKFKASLQEVDNLTQKVSDARMAFLSKYFTETEITEIIK